MGIGHNGRLAWGFTSGLSDEDDLYAEKLTGPETYTFKGEQRKMDCRDERFDFRSPPTDLPGDLADIIGGTRRWPAPASSVSAAPCTGRAGACDGVAYARRYAIWNRELETLGASRHSMTPTRSGPPTARCSASPGTRT
jgi:hypothetical protein